MNKNSLSYYKSKLGTGGVLVTLLIAIVLLLIYPAIGYFEGWVVGHICNWLWGDLLIGGINTTFQTNFSATMLPTLFGTMGMIASFFKEHDMTLEDDEDEEEETDDVL